MPFCPTCSQEFEGFASACPDCQVDLVEERPAADGPSEDPLRFLLFGAADEDVADLVARALEGMGIPHMVAELTLPGLADEVILFQLPAPLYNRAVTALERHPGLERDLFFPAEEAAEEAGETAEQPAEQVGEGLLLFRAAAGEGRREDEIRESELLTRPAAELARQGDEALVELLELVRRGVDPVRERAIVLLRAFGPGGIQAQARLLAVLAREGREAALYGLLREIRERVDRPEMLDELVDVCADRETAVRQRSLALHALGRCELMGLYERIVPLLDDSDPRIREDADEALCSLSDEDMGFDPELPSEERKAVMERWRAWFARRLG